MKKLFTNQLLILLVILLISNLSFAQHFSTIWSGNPYFPMNIIFQNATIDGVNVESGDEIAVFDIGTGGALVCVGTLVLTGTVSPSSTAVVTASADDPTTTTVIDGYTDGNEIIFKLWDNSESEEILIVYPTYNAVLDTVYSTFGTAFVMNLVGFSAVETTANSLTTCQGSVTLPIFVEDINLVNEFVLSLDYSTNNLSYVGYQNANSQLNSGTLTVVENSGNIDVSWNSTTVANIISDTLIEFLFTASTVYSQATENLTWDESNSYFLNSYSDSLQKTFTNGIITINPVPSASGSISGADSICKGTTGESYQVGAITNATSYVWDLSPTSAGTIVGNGTNITIDFSASYSGQTTLTVYGSNSCGNGTSASQIIEVITEPTADAGVNDTICDNSTHTLTGTATSQQSVLWTTSGNGTFDDATSLTATYTPGSNDIAAGSATLTLTAYAISPCAADSIDNLTLTIQPSPSSNANVDDTICEDDTYTLSGLASNQQSILWTSSGDGTFDDASSLTAVYTPGTTDISAGTATLTITAYAINPCGTNAADEMVLTIQVLPTADAGVDATTCIDASYTLSGTVTNQDSLLWTTAGDGSFDDATIIAATYTPGNNDNSNGTVVLTLTSYSVSPCTTNASDDITLTIQYLPTSDANADANICEDNTYTLSGTATNQQSVLWTTSGNGTFDDETSLTSTYTPGTTDITNESATLTLTANAISPCGVNAVDTMVLLVQPLPIINAGSNDTIYVDTTFLTNATASHQQSIYWTTSGDGTFNDTTLLAATYTPGSNDTTYGRVMLRLFAASLSPCGSTIIDSMYLFIQSTQQIALNNGWNLISFNKIPDNYDMLFILQDLINANSVIKVIDETGNFVQYIPGIGWMNTIVNMANNEGYYFKTNTTTQLALIGLPVLLPFEIPLISGWNMIGYPANYPRDALDVFQELINSGTFIKAIDESGGFVQFIPGFGWMNTIGNIEPGEGYYIKQNDIDTLIIGIDVPVVTTDSITNINATTATSGGDVIFDGGAPVIAKGVCWSTSSNPTIADSYTLDGAGIGSFTSNITGLVANVTYYVRAHATNNEVTSYGNEISFTTFVPFQCGNQIIYSGQSYNTVLIGTQCWMAENLNVGTRIDGANNQTDNSIIEKYCYDDDVDNCNTYGGMYQWDEMMQYVITEAVQGICPIGWHIPSDSEWTILSDYLGGTAVAGGKMKEAGTIHWDSPNTGATNSSGFTGLPGGDRFTDGSFLSLGDHGLWWSSTESNYGFGAWMWFLSYHNGEFNRTDSDNDKPNGFSVRCLKD